MRSPRISIIILNWNGWRDTIECLESLYRITYPNYDVIVVDNASQDDSIEKIKEYAEGKIEVNLKFFKYNPNNKPIKVFEVSEDEARQGKFNRPLYEKFDVDRRMILIKNKDNYGFAGGNNVGIKFALSVLDPEYVLLLNNDTVVDKRFLDELVKVAESYENVGIVCPMIYYYDKPKNIQVGGAKIFWQLGTPIALNPDKIHIQIYDSEFASGAAMFIRTSIFREVGLLSSIYGIGGWEDYDISIRTLNKGYKIKYIKLSKIWHKHFRSRKKVYHTTIWYSTKNKIMFWKKYAPRSFKIIGLLFVILFEIIAMIRVFKRLKKGKIIQEYVSAILAGLFDSC